MTSSKTQSLKRKLEETGEEKNDKSKVSDPRSRNCPYLDTIDRSVLDFDFEKVCSVSLSPINVYACLVCGKYFQGRAFKSFAYTHSLQADHNVYLNLATYKFYCLPEDYQIIDQSLEDIVYVLNPTFTEEKIKNIDSSAKLSRAFDDKLYTPGIVGLNNIKANDYCNVVLQVLSHVTPLRDYFLSEDNYKHLLKGEGDQQSMLVRRFGELMRKLWNPRNFKTQVSPHEMLQAVVLCSKKKFQITEQGDCYELLTWLLNSLNGILGGSKKAKNSCISDVFRGRMSVTSLKKPLVQTNIEDLEKLLQTKEYQENLSEMPFLYLTCDLPEMPLFPNKNKNENEIPEVDILDVLSKFDGMTATWQHTLKEPIVRTYEIIKLPRYLILNFKRFSSTTFNVVKNTTLVKYISELDFGYLMSPEARAVHESTTYDLIANIIHEGKLGLGKGTYKAQVHHKGSNKWFELQDLRVTEVHLPPKTELIDEVYVQIYELRSDHNQQPEEENNAQE